MNARMHRVLTAVLGSLTGVTALLAATDPASLGVGPQAWAWAAVALSVVTVTVTGIRNAWEA